MNDEYKIIFDVEYNNDFIKISIPCKEQELEGCEEATIVFYHNKKCFIISKYNCIGTAIEVLHNVLERALNNQFQLHSSIIKDIGYMTNEYFHDSTEEIFIIDKTMNNWIGINHLLWSPRGIGTWLYNKDSTILLEVAPLYKWHYVDPKKGENYVPYEEFIKNYKPYFILELSKDTAQQWLDKTKELLTIMKQNYEKYENLAQNSAHSGANRSENK